MMGDNRSPLPTVDLSTPVNQAEPSLSTPDRRRSDAEDPVLPSPSLSAANFQHADESQSPSRSLHPKRAGLGFRLPRSKSLLQGFERPSFSRIIILTVLCLITYPAFYVLTLVAKDKSLFIVRLVVSIWCSGVGFALGYVLLAVGAQHLEAASEYLSTYWLDVETF